MSCVFFNEVPFHIVMPNCVQVVFAGFSADALAQRIIDCKPKVVITCNAVKRGKKLIALKDIVDVSLADSAKNGVDVGMYNLTSMSWSLPKLASSDVMLRIPL